MGSETQNGGRKMIFKETPLQGAYVIDLEKREDGRGFFSRVWCGNEFEAHGLVSRVVQGNTSFNKVKGTLRGMHYQIAPHIETKAIRCIEGAIYDVIIDLRPDSPTYKKWFGVELTAENRTMLYVPGNFAHGFITLQDNSEVFYLVSEYYAPACERGVRYDDPTFAIAWPAQIEVISEKDRTWPDYREVNR
jgi:dTDP-4-dehydrorhamnose 3,5-epimerase